MGEPKTPGLRVSLLVIYPFPNILCSQRIDLWEALGNQTTTHRQPPLGDV